MEFKQPDRRVILCWAVYTLCAAVIPIVASIVLYALPLLPEWVSHIFTFLWISTLTIVLAVYYPLRYRRMRYAIGQESIVTVRGMLFSVYRRMPLCAVRHITTLRGPVERMTGLAAVLISATGGHLLIEGIAADEADRLTKTLL